MHYQKLLLSIEEKVATITINRPDQLNALNLETLKEIHSCLTELKNNDDVKVVIITGAGEKSFVAGADIKEFSAFNASEGEALAVQGQNEVFDFIAHFTKPVIAAINGFALGGGLELALACHVRLADSEAKLGLPEATLGLIPGYGGTQRLTQIVGRGIAYEMIFSGKMITAQRAYEIGLVNKVSWTDEDLLKSCKEMASSFLATSSASKALAIKAVEASQNSDGYAVESKAFGELFETDEFKEGVDAFLNKRKPNF